MNNSSAYRQSEIKESVDPIVGWHERLIKQVNEEWQAAWWFMKPKLDEWGNRLKLYNNQLRDKGRVGSPDIFAFHQALLAQLYDDQMIMTAQGRNDYDDDPAEALSLLGESDYEDADMSQADYEWDFDATLFGRGLNLMNDWDYDGDYPFSEIIDPLTFLRDPTAQSVHGSKAGLNGMRFGYREVRRTKEEIFSSGEYFNTEYLRRDAGGYRTFSPFWDAERARKMAQGFQTPYQSYNLSTNLEWTLTQGFTIVDGKRYLIELGNDRTLLVRMIPLGKRWPIIDRSLYPMSHDWDGVSVFDIMEDKQRFRASLINVYGDAAKRMAYPMWLFNENAIRKNVDKDPGFDKFIPTIGNPNEVVASFPQAKIGDGLNFVMDFLDKASQQSLGISSLSLGQAPPKRTPLGQLQMQQARLDARNSLAMKIWGWSERNRWRRWHELYEDNFKGSKEISFDGSSGLEHRKIKAADLKFSHPLGPKFIIETKKISEAKKIRKYQSKKDFLQMAMALPNTDKIYALRNLGEEVMKKNEVRLVIPYTPDELKALEENENLDKNKAVQIDIHEDHLVHLRINGQAKETPASEAHLKTHRWAYEMLRKNPQAMLPHQQPEQPEQPEGKGPIDKVKLAHPAMEGMGMELGQR